MRKIFGAALVAAVLPLSGATAATAATAGTSFDAGRNPGAYIVVLDDDANAGRVANEHARKHGAEVSHVYRTALRGYSARMSENAADRVAEESRVEFVQVDGMVSTMVQTLPTGVDRVNADTSATANIDGSDTRVDVDVAVIDTGVDLDHPDLNVHAAGARNCSNGRSAEDRNGHGSHVAGTIGALDDAAGVVGVAPGARIWPVRVLNNAGRGSFSDVICGIDYVTAHADEIEVANMSLGGGGSDDGDCGNTNDDALHQAICASVAAGVTYAVAAGNAFRDAANLVPAAYDEVITVSALADFDGQPGGTGSPTCRADEDDTFANFSNFGADIDLIAPGVCILSTWKRGDYNTISGTSMATPHAAGAAALYQANHPSAFPKRVKKFLQAKGSTEWIWPSQDPDGVQEPLLDVSEL